MFNSSVKEYDLICSLGANCSAALQLNYRKLRLCSLPFDWTCIKDDEGIYKLADGFKNNFNDYMLKENLIKVGDNAFSKAHADKVQYFDSAVNIYYYNHFKYELDYCNEYEKVKATFERRKKRFLEKIDSSQNILFLFASGRNFSKEAILYLAETIKICYPDKNIMTYFGLYGQAEDCVEEREEFSCCIYSYKRQMNDYDYKFTNYEWAFLDSLTVKRNSSLFFDWKKIKRGIACAILPRIQSLCTVKLYLFGLRLIISLGRIKNNL